MSPQSTESIEPPESLREVRLFDYGRTVALSDGVFAIAMTLLVLTIAVPNIPNSEGPHRLAHELGELWPQFFSYFLSFAVIGLNWLVHHQLFRMIAWFDRRLSVLNLAYLAFIALLPFPTDLLGEFTDSPLAIVVYATNIILISLLETTMYRHAAFHGLLREPQSADLVRRQTLLGLVAPSTFMLSIPVAFISPAIAPCIWILSWFLRRPAARALEVEPHYARKVGGRRG